ncbi:hypothetical protein TVAGG3_0168020 [Trichomonas vaginalis G3]|uniref:hypothetical protein n=1 Tax=Trichomonas vaginalis (strain ATCC PRA-98 / G3) TaxID=412133 RepID=UPI0021E5F87A|nr:hypothetical protein TVAGG3_0168020 [Trichomonas vaginalis G3]KAI5548380.1 hypothetical protein TVAGG3_0168020 [Trichomonas vaginalis G3]
MSVKTNNVKKLGFTNEEIKDILEEAGYEVDKYYLRNCQKFAEFLNEFDYDGKMNKDDVINFLYPTSKEEKPKEPDVFPEYYEERIKDDDEYNEIERLEKIRDEIDEKIKELREVEKYNENEVEGLMNIPASES